MVHYRLYYLLGEAHIVKADDLRADDDGAALSLASELLERSGFNRGELWQSSRLLSALRAARAAWGSPILP